MNHFTLAASIVSTLFCIAMASRGFPTMTQDDLAKITDFIDKYTVFDPSTIRIADPIVWACLARYKEYAGPYAVEIAVAPVDTILEMARLHAEKHIMLQEYGHWIPIGRRR